MKQACGLDFGTSNSTLAVFNQAAPQLVQLENEKSTIPSAVFFGQEQAETFLVGRAAVDAYVDGASGRFMRSLKSILGNSLLQERTPIYRKKISFAEIIAQYLAELKQRAENNLQTELTHVVMGRPVQFVDNDIAANQLAENNLNDIAKAIGFKHVSFQFEPVAAALEFERQLSTEKLAFIADIGGGTSDFSVVRLGGNKAGKDRTADVLANSGIRVGGTDFDRALSIAALMPSFGFKTFMKGGHLELPAAPFLDLSTWSSIHNLYEPKFMALLKAIRFDAEQPELLERLIHVVSERRCHSLLMEVEKLKIALSENPIAQMHLDWVEKQLCVSVDQNQFEKSGQTLYDKLQKSVFECLQAAAISPDKIAVIFFTGGTSMVPRVRHQIAQNFPHAEIVNGDQFGAVGLGLGIEAGLRYG
jgi:hypothetical chaperone protein